MYHHTDAKSIAINQKKALHTAHTRGPIHAKRYHEPFANERDRAHSAGSARTHAPGDEEDDELGVAPNVEDVEGGDGRVRREQAAEEAEHAHSRVSNAFALALDGEESRMEGRV